MIQTKKNKCKYSLQVFTRLLKFTVTDVFQNGFNKEKEITELRRLDCQNRKVLILQQQIENLWSMSTGKLVKCERN